MEFLLAAGPAEALRPLGAVASGGETARVMMALKAAPASVLAESGHSSAGKLLRSARMIPKQCHLGNLLPAQLIVPLQQNTNSRPSYIVHLLQFLSMDHQSRRKPEAPGLGKGVSGLMSQWCLQASLAGAARPS